jgi:alpha-L-fucosidase
MTNDISTPTPLPPTPSPAQKAWQEMELTMFVHFTVNTYTDREWGMGAEDPKIFNPVRLDARQWVAAAKAAGFKLMILTAKHHDGFCLWPSRQTEHSVKNSPWRGGNGDVVREFTDACREFGMRAGLYLSPWDRHEKTYGDSPRYNDYYCAQLTELLTDYGPLAEIWFDGACGEGSNGRKQEYDWPRIWGLVRKHQPEAMIFSDAGPDVRWIGNEEGIAGDPCWATFDPHGVPKPGASGNDILALLQHGQRGGSVWRPGESDVSIRPGWFWHQHENKNIKTVDHLLDLYFKSVGRNTVFLVNVPPNRDGLFSEEDVKRLHEFRVALDKLFETDLAAGCRARADNVRANSDRFGAERALDGNPETYWATDDDISCATLEIDLGRAVQFNVLSLQEPIALGQRIEAFRLEAWKNGKWVQVLNGTTVGHRRLERFQSVTTDRIRLVIEKALACPALQTVSVYHDADYQPLPAPEVNRETYTLPEVSVPRVASAGGDSARVDWENGVCLTPWLAITGHATERNVSSRILHDGEWLYIELAERCETSLLVSDLPEFWNNDHWELFLADTRDGKRYTQIGVDVFGKLKCLRWGEPHNPIHESWTPAVRVISTREDDCWRVRVALPLAEVLPSGLLPKNRTVFANFGRLTSLACRPYEWLGVHHLAWCPTFRRGFVDIAKSLGSLALE